LPADDDLLYDELNRQLAEARATADGLATRSGLLLAADGIGGAILAPSIHAGQHQSLLVLTLAAFAVAVIAGGLSLMPALKIGPRQTFLARAIVQPTPTTSSVLYDSKLGILDSNLRRVLVMQVFLGTQAATTLISLALALIYVAWK
jgi:hypothetical protein